MTKYQDFTDTIVKSIDEAFPDEGMLDMLDLVARTRITKNHDAILESLRDVGKYLDENGVDGMESDQFSTALAKAIESVQEQAKPKNRPCTFGQAVADADARQDAASGD